MSKHNIITKKLKKQFLSVNNLIESYFNNLNNLILVLKKSKFNLNNRVFLIISSIFLFICFYFLLPSTYNKKIIQNKIENQIFNSYGVELNFKEKIQYGLFPKPHFASSKVFINQDGSKIAEVNKFRIFISFNKFFSFNNVEIKDIFISKSDFNLNKDNINFFKNLLINVSGDKKVNIKNSNIFYKDDNEETLFLIKIKNSKFYYDIKKNENNLLSNHEIFNLPFLFKIKNNDKNDQLLFEIESKKIRLFIENNLNYKNKIKNGLLDISLINKSTSLNYQISEKILNFSSSDNKNFYNGQIDFVPFYFKSNFDFDYLNLKNFFKRDSFLTELIKSDILNNENLNMDINLNVGRLINLSQLNEIFLKMNISEGNIDFSDSSMLWNDDLKIYLKESLLTNDQNDIFLIGKILIELKDIDNFYSSFQIKKNNRKKIKNIEFDFNYNLIENKIVFNNTKIDGNIDIDLENFIQDFNLQGKKFFNKITFKNFVNNFFGNYKG